MIFPSMSQAKFVYLDFISIKFSCSNARVSFADVGVERQNRTIYIRGSLNRTIFLSMCEVKLFNLEFISVSNEKVSFAAVGLEQQNRAIDICRALKSYDFSKHGWGEIFSFRFFVGKIQSC